MWHKVWIPEVGRLVARAGFTAMGKLLKLSEPCSF